MKNSLEEKRKEIFELHQSWLRPETPLMRNPARPSATVNTENEKVTNASISKKSRFNTAVIIITIIVVILEFLFFANELGWFK
ncbi:hypothetical protein [Dyadobacter sp. NIV53]|uniref:hypothetical protein n=1 Tax=Dyadobacter sp. NIV53 TaxID=2861765 RepID=UPI001C882653|nr:hypothetical protein [Dyadobacter sp. NIV53]